MKKFDGKDTASYKECNELYLKLIEWKKKYWDEIGDGNRDAITTVIGYMDEIQADLGLPY